MSNASEAGAGLLGAMRTLRDIWVDAAAKSTLYITGSTPYARISNALSQPGLVAAGLLRQARERSMAQLLGYLNMPSRDEVISLSQRLTHIEMALDDLSAGQGAQAARSTAASAPEAVRPAAPVKSAASPRPVGEA